MADYKLMGGEAAGVDWKEDDQGNLVPIAWEDKDPRRAQLHTGTQVKSFNTGHTEESLKEQLTGSVSSEFSGPLGFFADLFKGLGEILGGAFEFGVGVLKFVVDGVKGFIEKLTDAFNPDKILDQFDPFSEIQDAFRSGQHDIADRVDLLEDIQGYAQSYMGHNQNAQWSFTDKWRTLVFDEPLGPVLGAAVTSEGMIELGSKGLWEIGVRATADGSNWGGHPDLLLEANIFYPDGGLYEQKVVETHSYYTGNELRLESYRKTIETHFPVVVDGPGYKVQIRAKVGQWRWWLGGSRFSMLSAVKVSRDDTTPGHDTVPNETRDQAEVTG